MVYKKGAKRRIFKITLGAILICLPILAFCLAAESQEIKKVPNIKLFGFSHIWARYDKTRGPNYGEDLTVARARVGLRGDLVSNINYTVLTEWGRLTFNDPVTLLDAWVNFKVNPGLNIKIGQFWYMFTLSGTEILPKIPFIIRPEVIDGIWLPMGRKGSYGYDKGIEIRGNSEEGILPWGYIFSITTGTGLNKLEDNDKKDFAGRVWFEPLKGLRLGASGFRGWSRVEMTSDLGRMDKEDISEYAYGFELSYNQKYFRIISEYLKAHYDGFLRQEGAEIFSLSTQKPWGWYAMFGWKPLPNIEIPVRYAWYENDSTMSDTGLSTVTLGLTWYIKGDNNIKFNYYIRDPEQNYGSKLGNLIAVQAQVVF
ncbi:MAG: porin [Candidatus Omnitrophota bacterium]